MKVETILYPTDFTGGSEEAARAARDLAERYGARIIVLHVVYDIARTAGWSVTQIDTDALYEAMEAGAKKELDRYAKDFFAGLARTEYVVMRGIPQDDIVSFAQEHKADLIVMGTHGRKGIDRLLFGSTASKVVRNALCPVLSVRGV